MKIKKEKNKNKDKKLLNRGKQHLCAFPGTSIIYKMMSRLKITHFIYWKLIDIKKSSEGQNKPHIYGIKCVTGMYGQGKTVTMTYLANKFRNKYGNDIFIMSNYGLSIQDKEFNSIEDITKNYDKNVIFFWDEVQNDFPATDKNFSKELRIALSLCRKGNGKAFYWSSQDHELVHKTIRRLTIEYIQVKTLSGRLTKLKSYDPYDYQLMFEQNDIDKKIKIRPRRIESFIQTDELRNQYNSFGIDNGEKIT